MLRKATADDLPALTALRCGAAKANPVDAAGWLQNVAGLEPRRLAVRRSRGAGRADGPPAAQNHGGLPACLRGQRV